MSIEKLKLIVPQQIRVVLGNFLRQISVKYYPIKKNYPNKDDYYASEEFMQHSIDAACCSKVGTICLYSEAGYVSSNVREAVAKFIIFVSQCLPPFDVSLGNEFLLEFADKVRRLKKIFSTTDFKTPEQQDNLFRQLEGIKPSLTIDDLGSLKMQLQTYLNQTIPCYGLFRREVKSKNFEFANYLIRHIEELQSSSADQLPYILQFKLYLRISCIFDAIDDNAQSYWFASPGKLKEIVRGLPYMPYHVSSILLEKEHISRESLEKEVDTEFARFKNLELERHQVDSSTGSEHKVS